MLGKLSEQNQEQNNRFEKEVRKWKFLQDLFSSPLPAECFIFVEHARHVARSFRRRRRRRRREGP